jgi:molecular chaperone DnaK
MVKDAEVHSTEDKKRREEVDIRNRADQLVYETEKSLKEYGDRLDSETKSKVESAVGRVKEALKKNDIQEIKSATESLTAVWHEAASKMYQKSSTQTHPGSQGKSEEKSGKGKDKAVDADYEVVN